MKIKISNFLYVVAFAALFAVPQFIKFSSFEKGAAPGNQIQTAKVKASPDNQVATRMPASISSATIKPAQPAIQKKKLPK